jgi:hypothetical protein
MFMRIACLILGLVPFAVAGPMVTMTYSGSPCTTSAPPHYQTGITGMGSYGVVATALAYYNPPGIGSLPSSGCLVTASDQLVATGSGTGFLAFSLMGDAESDPSFYVNGIFEGRCSGFGCNPSSGMIPVTLGIPFDISVDAIATYSPVGCCTSSNIIQATIQVYDSGQQLQTISDFVAASVPEPGAGWLALFGLAALAFPLGARAWRSADHARSRLA